MTSDINPTSLSRYRRESRVVFVLRCVCTCLISEFHPCARYNFPILFTTGPENVAKKDVGQDIGAGDEDHRQAGSWDLTARPCSSLWDFGTNH